MYPMRVFILLIPLIVVASCMRQSEHPNLQNEMSRLRAATYELYSYAWQPDEFVAARNTKRISQLLHNIEDTFFRVEGGNHSNEIGYRAALRAQQQLISNISTRFDDGEKEEANLKLRAVAGNCVACHTRSEVPGDFFGSEPPIGRSSLENQLAAVQYLFATRQFKRADEELLRYAEKTAIHPLAYKYSIRALELWPINQVRVHYLPRKTAENLQHLLSRLPLQYKDRDIVLNWISDLKNLPLESQPTRGQLHEAKLLLGNDIRNQSFAEDRNRLVRTLRATAILHNILQEKPPQPEKASFFLALAYNHLPIEALDNLKDLYLQEVIMEFPGTPEAKEALAIYRANNQLVPYK